MLNAKCVPCATAFILDDDNCVELPGTNNYNCWIQIYDKLHGEKGTPHLGGSIKRINFISLSGEIIAIMPTVNFIAL